MLVHAVLCPIPYFVAFLFAYGFSDGPSVARHAFFLGQIATLVAVMTLVTAPIVRGFTTLPPRRALVLAAAVGCTTHLMVLAAGAVVSSMNVDNGSVSAGFSPATHVAIPIVLVLAAAGSTEVVRRASAPAP